MLRSNHSKMVVLITMLLAVLLTVAACGSQSATLYHIIQDGKYGYIDKTGEIVIEPQFDNAYDFREENLAAVQVDGEWGFIDKTGEIVIEPQFDDVGGFSEGLAAVRVGDEWGFVNETGELVIEPQFAGALWFEEGLAMVTVGNKDGYIDKTGEIVIEPQFDFAYPFSEGLANVEIDGKRGFIDKTGEFVIEPQYIEAHWFFYEGLALAYSEDEDGQTQLDYIDQKGEVVFSLPSDLEISSFSFGDLTLYFLPGGPFSEDLAAVNDTKNNHVYYVDKKGNTVIEPDVDDGWAFSEGLAVVEVDEQYGYIDKKGEIVIEPQFDDANHFFEGIAAVKIGEKLGYINKDGEYIWEPTN